MTETELSLRPSLLREYIGQDDLKSSLGLFLEAARRRGESLDHTLIAGPPGLGKTTLAHIVANEMGSRIHVVAGPNLDKKGDLASILTHLEARDVLFIDEIHRMKREVEEVLYSAMEDYRLDVVAGHGSGAKTLSIDLARFTLVGATTRSGMLTNPLRDRFGVQFRMELYPVRELEQIVRRSAGILGLELDDEAGRELAARSRGTPRIANRLLRRVRDFAEVHSSAPVEPVIGPEPGPLASPAPPRRVDRETARRAMDLLKIDEWGLEALDRRYLRAIQDVFGGGPVGLSTLASVVGEDAETLADVHEPFLIRQGFVQKTPRGRVITPWAAERFGGGAAPPERRAS